MTPTGQSDLERIRGVAVRLREVRKILMTPVPEQLGECGPALEEAVELLGSIKSRPDPMGELHVGELHMVELHAVQRELAVVSALMQQAAGYYLGWAQMLGAATGGYTPQGEASPLTSEPRLTVEG